MDRVVSLMINIQLKVPAVSTDINTCESECTKLKGRAPYLFEGKCQDRNSHGSLVFLKFKKVIGMMYPNINIPF